MIRKMSEVLKEVFLGILFFGLIAQIIGAFIVKNQAVYAIGLWIGIIMAAAMAVHMEYSISRSIELGEGGAPKYVQKHSVIRYACVVIVFAIMSYLNATAIVPCFIGIMGLKVAAYLQPFTHKIILKVQGKKDSD